MVQERGVAGDLRQNVKKWLGAGLAIPSLA
jgi:hypothetical protein